VLRLVGVGKGYRRTGTVLREVSLDVRPGEVVAVSGGNGCGKSTLIRVAAGLTAPTNGAVRGRPTRFALVPDRFTAPQRMTARQYLLLHARMRGLDARGAARRAGELADRLDVSPGLDAELTRLSQGNARKVQVAQAFLGTPGLLLLDEVTATLDDRGVAAVDALLREVSAAGTAVLRADPAGLSVAADHHLRLRGGRLERSAPLGMATLTLGRAGDSASPVRLTVADDDADRVLLERLQDGWSVLRVERAGP